MTISESTFLYEIFVRNVIVSSSIAKHEVLCLSPELSKELLGFCIRNVSVAARNLDLCAVMAKGAQIYITGEMRVYYGTYLLSL